ncbi:MAG: hypothetical protein OHK0046_20420 [Anaerolineae bacterium]
MTENRNHQLMHRALDNELSPDAERELAHLLNRDPDEAHTFDKLQRVENLLRTAPHERAPERLALTIMARMAQMVNDQMAVEMDEMEAHLALTDAMMQVALSTVTVATLPLLQGAAQMLLNTRSNPEAVEAVLLRIATLLLLTIDIIDVMLEEAEATFEENPEAAMALLTMIPATLLTLVRYMLEDDDEAQDD